MMRLHNITAVFALLIAIGLAGCSVTDSVGEPTVYTVSGTVMVPAELLASLQKQAEPTLLARVLFAVIPEAWADTSGSVGGTVGAGGSYVPISGVQVELVRVGYDVGTDTYYEIPLTCDGGCPITAGDGSFTVVTTEFPASTLALKVTFIDPVDGVTEVVMRSLVYDTTVDVTPVSEATTQIIVEALSEFVDFENFTVNEVGALVHMVEDEDIDISGLDFTEAINKIKTDAADVLSRFIIGFQEGGEMNVANANDIFHLMELESRLVSPDVTYVNGALDYEASLGGAISFDNNGNFQPGGAVYYWGLRSQFSGDPVRLFDQALNELEQDPSLPAYQAYLTYGVPIGFRGIVAANNGMSVAHSSTEKTTPGFLSNDGGLMAFLSEKNDETQLIYDRGLRVLMRKWKSTSNTYNDSFNFANSTISWSDGIDDIVTNLNNDTSIDLNPLMDQRTYNVVMYQNYLNSGGLESGVGTGTWFFDTTNQKTVNDGTGATAKLHGQMTVAGLDLDAMNYILSIGALTRNAAKAMEPCPNLFVIEAGGGLMLRRDSANNNCNGIDFNIFSGTGAVSSDGEMFVVPQVHDDIEDDQALELPITGGAGRRGWYVGVKQQTALSVNNVQGIYHVVGQITHIDGNVDSVSHESVHGNLQFVPQIDDGAGNKQVVGTLHKKRASMDEVYVDATVPTLSKTKSVSESVSGTYKVAPNGTVTFTLPGTTETVTGAAGQLLTLNDGRQFAMFMVLPINTNSSGQGSRGLMLLAHEFIVNYPVPPDPPGPPAPPDDTPPLPPS